MLEFEIRKKKSFKTDMAPLIDVVFLLLIFFMLTFALPRQGMDLTLPSNTSTVISNKSQLIIKVDNVGTIKINGEAVPLDGLINKLRKELDQRHDKSVSIETGNKTIYDLFVSIIDKARQAGAKEFSLIM